MATEYNITNYITVIDPQALTSISPTLLSISQAKDLWYKVKPCGRLVRPVAPTRIPGRYLSHQEGLPKLPVPSLQQTCERYLATLEPIVDEEELSHTKELLAEFQKAGGVGERLQKGLERRVRKTENWVSWLKSNPNPVLKYSI